MVLVMLVFRSCPSQQLIFPAGTATTIMTVLWWHAGRQVLQEHSRPFHPPSLWWGGAHWSIVHRGDFLVAIRAMTTAAPPRAPSAVAAKDHLFVTWATHERIALVVRTLCALIGACVGAIAFFVSVGILPRSNYFLLRFWFEFSVSSEFGVVRAVVVCVWWWCERTTQRRPLCNSSFSGFGVNGKPLKAGWGSCRFGTKRTFCVAPASRFCCLGNTTE